MFKKLNISNTQWYRTNMSTPGGGNRHIERNEIKASLKNSRANSKSFSCVPSTWGQVVINVNCEGTDCPTSMIWLFAAHMTFLLIWLYALHLTFFSRGSIFLACLSFWGLNCTFDSLSKLHTLLTGPYSLIYQGFFWKLSGSLITLTLHSNCL